MGPVLRIVNALGLVFVLAAVALVLADGDGLRQRLEAPGALTALLGLVLALAMVALLPAARGWQQAESDAREHAAHAAALQAELVRAECRRRELLVTLSHDLRTPLASMQGYLELLLLRYGQLERAEAEGYLQTAARHSRRLAQRVDDLFELARLEAGDVELRAEPFPIGELAHDVAQRYASAAASAGVDLQVRCDAAPMVDGEIALVERALGNLLDNALRHTPRGGQVAIEIQAADTGPARVGVIDTGEGIAEPDTLFDRFETLPRTGDSGSQRPGLGLAIVRRIAALHGSALDVQSRPGEGTRIAFALARSGARH